MACVALSEVVINVSVVSPQDGVKECIAVSAGCLTHIRKTAESVIEMTTGSSTNLFYPEFNFMIGMYKYRQKF